MSAAATTKVCRRGTLADHADCYKEVCRLERENADLRAQLAAIRADAVRALCGPADDEPVELDW